MDSEHERYLEQAQFSCKEAAKLLDPYLDDELNTVLFERYERHLSQCEECRLSVAEARRMLEIVGTLDQQPLDQSIRLRLRTVLKERVGFEPNKEGATLRLVDSQDTHS